MLGICVPLNPQSPAIGAGVEWYDSGIGFAIPLSGAEELFERLKNGERISPSAFLGVQAMPNPAGKGLWVERPVVQDTPADEIGLERQDLILGVNGEDVADMLRLRQVLNRFESGEEIELTIIKDDGKNQETQVKLKLGIAPQPDNQLENWSRRRFASWRSGS